MMLTKTTYTIKRYRDDNGKPVVRNSFATVIDVIRVDTYWLFGFIPIYKSQVILNTTTR